MPNDDLSQEIQGQSLKTLEEENRLESENLENIVKRGEELLGLIQAASSNIAHHMIDTSRDTNHSGEWMKKIKHEQWLNSDEFVYWKDQKYQKELLKLSDGNYLKAADVADLLSVCPFLAFERF